MCARRERRKCRSATSKQKGLWSKLLELGLSPCSLQIVFKSIFRGIQVNLSNQFCCYPTFFSKSLDLFTASEASFSLDLMVDLASAKSSRKLCIAPASAPPELQVVSGGGKGRSS